MSGDRRAALAAPHRLAAQDPSRLFAKRQRRGFRPAHPPRLRGLRRSDRRRVQDASLTQGLRWIDEMAPTSSRGGLFRQVAGLTKGRVRLFVARGVRTLRGRERSGCEPRLRRVPRTLTLLSHRTYLSISFRESTSPQNCQLNVYY